ncbi:MAG: dUTP diphosphatase [Bacillota bacterium]
MKIKIKRMDDGVKLPDYQHYGEDVGLDLRANESLELAPGDYRLVKTGLKIAIPSGFAGFVYPRSGLALKRGITVLNADGVIDPGYRGEVGVILINHGQEAFSIARGDRIAQLIIQRKFNIEWEEVEQLRESKRGQGGFGHTGV